MFTLENSFSLDILFSQLSKNYQDVKHANEAYACSLERPGGGGDSHMEWTGMLVGNFKFNP